MATIFTKIVEGELPCFKILEDKKYLAFLDVQPMAKGHTLVIPKNEIDYFFDIDDRMLAGLMAFSKKVAHALKKAVPCQRIGVMVAGLEVPHAHVHLVPISSTSELTFANSKPADNDELEELANKIKEYF